MFNNHQKYLLWNAIIMGPLLIYIGIRGENSGNNLFGITLGLGILTFIFNSLTLLKSVTPQEAFEKKISFKRN